MMPIFPDRATHDNAFVTRLDENPAEALNNVRRHAQASSASIEVEGGDDGITMTVTDNGRGFDVPGRIEDMVNKGRLGLMGMYERAGLLNGSLEIQSKSGEGTKVIVKLPWYVRGKDN